MRDDIRALMTTQGHLYNCTARRAASTYWPAGMSHPDWYASCQSTGQVYSELNIVRTEKAQDFTCSQKARMRDSKRGMAVKAAASAAVMGPRRPLRSREVRWMREGNDA